MNKSKSHRVVALSDTATFWWWWMYERLIRCKLWTPAIPMASYWTY